MPFWKQIFAVALALGLAGPAGAVTGRDSGPLPPEAMPHGPLPAQVWVCFTPAQQCDASIVAAIRNARQSIRVQAYGFTAPVILNALAEAKERGVDVQAILDKTNDPQDRLGRRNARPANGPRLNGADFTAAVGIPTWIDHSVAIAHNKVMIIDGKTVIGGSYNYTISAEQRNAENVTLVESPEVARVYTANWEARQKVSRRFTPYTPPSALVRDPARAVARGTDADR